MTTRPPASIQPLHQQQHEQQPLLLPEQQQQQQQDGDDGWRQHQHHTNAAVRRGGGGGGGLLSAVVSPPATGISAFDVAGPSPSLAPRSAFAALHSGGGGAAAAVAIDPLFASLGAGLDDDDGIGGGSGDCDDDASAILIGGSGGGGLDGDARKNLLSMARRLWLLAWPLSWMEVLTFAKELLVTGYVGRLGAAELSALVLAQTVYNVTGNAPMLGFVTAMETFCGQAYGARCYPLVGVVLQRGLAISLAYCCGAAVLWRWSEPLLLAMGQDAAIAAAAARFTRALTPALFLDAADQCCRRYLSSQSVVRPLMLVTLLATMLTPLYLWLFVARMKLGLLGAAVAWDAVQATSLCLMAACVVRHARRQPLGRRTWSGWTLDAFRGWGEYIRMALPSCVMICLDWWTFEVIVMLSGLLPRPEQTMSMMGITFNLHALCFFAAHGLSGAASTRVANSLGAGRPRLAWMTVQVAVLMGTLTMAASSLALLLARRQLGRLFTTELAVVELTAQAVPPLAVSLIGEGANTVLAGVMRGCGRQRVGAAINLATYWGIGLPLACWLAFRQGLGALGLWAGLACTASLQALLLAVTVFRFNWAGEAKRARMLVAAGGSGGGGGGGGHAVVPLSPGPGGGVGGAAAAAAAAALVMGAAGEGGGWENGGGDDKDGAAATAAAVLREGAGSRAGARTRGGGGGGGGGAARATPE